MFASPQISAELWACKMLASAAWSLRDKEKNARDPQWGPPTVKRSYGSGERQWKGGKPVSKGGDQAKGQGKKAKRRKPRWGKGKY